MLDKRTKISLIANPTAGQGRAKGIAISAQRELGERGYSVELKFTEDGGHGIELAREASQAGYGVVVAIGGDGTISEVVNGIAGSGAMLGVIPGGTADVFSKEMGLPKDLPSAIQVIVNGNTSKIDLGLTSAGKYFLLMAGIGFDAEVVENINLNLKRWLKDAAYPIAGLQTITQYELPQLMLEVNGNQYKGSFAVIGNARYYGGVFSITSKAKIDDGYIDICIFQGSDKTAFYKYLVGTLTRTHLAFKDVAYIRAKEVKVTSDRRTLVQADGEIIGELPMEFTIKSKMLTVLVP